MTWATRTHRNANYLYRIKSHAHYGFYTTQNADGQKGIIGTMIRNILRVIFDKDGNYEKTTIIELPRQIDPVLHLRFPDWKDPEVAKIMEDEQLSECAIEVHRFFDVDHNVGIKDLPDTYASYLENEMNYLLPEREEVRIQEKDWIESQIKGWKLREDYVFWWENDYYVNKLGEVMSS